MEVTLERRRRDAERHRIARENETPEQTQTRRQHDNDWHRATRQAENAQQAEARLEGARQSRRKKTIGLSKYSHEL